MSGKIVKPPSQGGGIAPFVGKVAHHLLDTFVKTKNAAELVKMEADIRGRIKVIEADVMMETDFGLRRRRK